MLTSTTKGVIAAIASAVCYGMNPLGALYLYKDGINTDSALFYRFSLASLLLGITLLIQRETFKLDKRELAFSILLGLMFAVSSLTYYDSFHYMDAGISSTILFIYPIMVAIIMAAVFHEKLTYPMMAAIFLSMVGVAILYNGEGVKLSITGVILVLISALAYAIYIVIVNRARLQVSATKLTFFATLFCACFIFIHSLTTTDNHIIVPYSANIWFYAMILALFPGLLSLLLLAVAVRNIGSTQTAIFGALEPVSALCVGVFVFGEKVTFKMGIGILLVLLSVTLIILARRKKNQSAKVAESPNFK